MQDKEDSQLEGLASGCDLGSDDCEHEDEFPEAQTAILSGIKWRFTQKTMISWNEA